MIDKRQTLDALLALRSEFEEETFFRRQTLYFVEQQAEFWQRTNLEGHLTGSAWVLHPDGDRALLIHHRKLGKWFQPGGHVEPDDRSLLDTARREAMEECGTGALTALSEAVFDLDIHVIPAKAELPEHLHYDLRFVFQAGSGDLSGDQAEIRDLRWAPIQDLVLQPDIQQSIRRMALKSRKWHRF